MKGSIKCYFTYQLKLIYTKIPINNGNYLLGTPHYKVLVINLTVDVTNQLQTECIFSSTGKIHKMHKQSFTNHGIGGP